MLEREAGPSGWVEVEGQQYPIDGWELFEGDEASPHMCRGWFRFQPEAFAAAAGSTVQLELETEDGQMRRLTAMLQKARSTAPEWEFRADR